MSSADTTNNNDNGSGTGAGSAKKERTSACSFCSMTFNKREHLQRHERTHTHDRPYTCEAEGCGKTFARRDTLTRHQRLHKRDDDVMGGGAGSASETAKTSKKKRKPRTNSGSSRKSPTFDNPPLPLPKDLVAGPSRLSRSPFLDDDDSDTKLTTPADTDDDTEPERVKNEVDDEMRPEQPTPQGFATASLLYSMSTAPPSFSAPVTADSSVNGESSSSSGSIDELSGPAVFAATSINRPGSSLGLDLGGEAPMDAFGKRQQDEYRPEPLPAFVQDASSHFAGLQIFRDQQQQQHQPEQQKHADAVEFGQQQQQHAESGKPGPDSRGHGSNSNDRLTNNNGSNNGGQPQSFLACGAGGSLSSQLLKLDALARAQAYAAFAAASRNSRFHLGYVPTSPTSTVDSDMKDSTSPPSLLATSAYSPVSDVSSLPSTTRFSDLPLPPMVFDKAPLFEDNFDHLWNGEDRRNDGDVHAFKHSAAFMEPITIAPGLNDPNAPLGASDRDQLLRHLRSSHAASSSDDFLRWPTRSESPSFTANSLSDGFSPAQTWASDRSSSPSSSCSFLDLNDYEFDASQNSLFSGVSTEASKLQTSNLPSSSKRTGSNVYSSHISSGLVSPIASLEQFMHGRMA